MAVFADKALVEEGYAFVVDGRGFGGRLAVFFFGSAALDASMFHGSVTTDL